MTAAARALLLTLSLLFPGQFSLSTTGELHLSITDQSGLPLQASVRLFSQSSDVSQLVESDSLGVAVLKRVPLGRYVLEVERAGFVSFNGVVDVQSTLPFEYHVTLTVGGIAAQVTVTPDQTLVDTGESGAVSRIGARTIETRVLSLPGRSLPALIDTQPGWLLEANGILHPRGSEYQTQLVVDGLPVTDNRSPAFAPALDADTVQSLTVLTAGYPAEYGRKLGGVVEALTAYATRQGLHGAFVASGEVSTLLAASRSDSTCGRIHPLA
jgi:hypothetical protein